MISESPQVRRRPTRVKPKDPQRDSNLVRASVLETALELGFGQNSTVADWIFNNPLSEESEDLRLEPEERGKREAKPERAPDTAEVATPPFTSGSNSTSDESSLDSLGNNAGSAAITSVQVHMRKPSVVESPHVHFDDFPTNQLQLFSPFALSQPDQETGDNLLGKLSRSTERSRSQDDSLVGSSGHKSPSPGSADSGYSSDGQHLSKGKANKGKDKHGRAKSTKSKALDIGKTGERDGDYASDGGYLSASSNKSRGRSPGKVKSRAMAFFRRRSKKSAHGSDDDDEDFIPPVPAIPVLPRPSSPRLLERRVAPSSPTRSGFSPLTLNLTNPPASPPRRRVSKSPPPVHARGASPQRSNDLLAPRKPASPVVALALASTLPTPAATAATFPLPPSIPGTPLSTASFPSTSTSSIQLGAGPISTPRYFATQSSRQHLSIPPPTPPPTHPLPQPPPSPSTSSNGLVPPFPATPTRSPRRGAPARPIPAVPMNPGSTQPLVPSRVASPFKPPPSPRVLPTAPSHGRTGELPNGFQADQFDEREVTGRQRSSTVVSTNSGSAPAFLQRRIQHGLPPSPWHPPPDTPLPPSPRPAPNTYPHTPIISPSKFHEHFSSVSSVPLSQILSTPTSMSPSPSTVTLSGSSSGLSVRSSHVSSTSERSKELAIRDSLSILESSRPTTSAATVSEASYGQPITSVLSRPALDVNQRFSDRSDAGSSIYSPSMQQDTHSVSIYDDDADVDDATSKTFVDEEDDDASLYPPEDKTAGRRTMYLVEHGELDENGDEIVITGSRYWGGQEMHPPLPPLPPMPPMPTRPGPGYF